VWFLLLLFRFSVLPVAAAAPQVGQAAPDFVLTDDTGAPLQLAGLRGKNVLLVFYRGHW
jgi:peroxiredoxin